MPVVECGGTMDRRDVACRPVESRQANGLRKQEGLNVRRLIGFAGRYARALLGCIYLFTVGVLQKKHRKLLYAIGKHFGSGGRKRCKLPRILMAEIVEQPVRLALYELERGPGNIAIMEIVVLASLLRTHAPERCLEIGTCDGRTTLNMAANTPDTTQIYTLDLPPDGNDRAELPLDGADGQFIAMDRRHRRFEDYPEARKITQLWGDSARFDFTELENTMDFVFVDGSHSYEYLMCDSQTALRLLKPEGGVIVWHDYGGWPGVTRGLNELFDSRGVFEGLRHIRGTSLCVLRTGSAARAREPVPHGVQAQC